MGILRINALLAERAPKAFQTVPLYNFHGMRVAIDGCNWIYSHASTVYRDVVNATVDPLQPIDRKEVERLLIEQLVFFINKLSSHGITAVWCWDGKTVPDKDVTREKRMEAKNKILDKIDEQRAELEAINPLLRTQEQLRNFKSVLARHLVIFPSEMAYVRNFIDLMGYPSLQAETEGEKLCAALAREGVVGAVWSTDTDNYPLGTPITITGIKGYDGRQLLVSVVYLPVILSELKMSQEQFVDLCILCGCDFNTNIPLIGPKKAWNLMVKYESLDKADIKKIELLRHVRCRELFAYTPSNLSSPPDFNRTKFVECSRDVAGQYSITHLYPTILDSIKYIPPPISPGEVRARGNKMISRLYIPEMTAIYVANITRLTELVAQIVSAPPTKTELEKEYNILRQQTEELALLINS